MLSYTFLWSPLAVVLAVGVLLSSVYLALIVFAIVALATLAAIVAAPYLLVRSIAQWRERHVAARADVLWHAEGATHLHEDPRRASR
jgi:hypothetical protein